MTKKHFILLADYLREANLSDKQLQAVIRFCKHINPRFKEILWLNYLYGFCGPNGGKVNDAD